MTITAEATTEQFVGPCGCPACEKWADCDYCGTCTPEQEPVWMNCGCSDCERQFQGWLAAEQARERDGFEAESLSFAEWLYRDDSDEDD